MATVTVRMPRKSTSTPRTEERVQQYFELLQPYTPAYRTFEGGVYEMELTKAIIHRFATHVSKLKPEVIGPEQHNSALEKRLQYKPNPIMDTKKYLYRLATMYKTNNNALICPLYNDTFERIIGYYPMHPDKSELVRENGRLYLRYDFGYGQKSAIEFEFVGRMSQFQNKDELFGDSNAAFKPTLEMLNANNQAIIEGVKNSANLRFLAILANTLRDEEIEKQRQVFRSENFNSKNNGGALILDGRYQEVKQIDSKPLFVDDKQLKIIRENAFYYFGSNEKILTNSFTSNDWQAYYEGEIEPFAIEASLVHTNMTYSPRQISAGNMIMFTANRLQYMSNSEKLETVTQLFDRGFITHNQGLDIFNMPGIGEAGNRRYVRKEYALQEYNEKGNDNNANQEGTPVQEHEPLDPADGIETQED